ncbi:MAG: YwbE family protein [Mucilaginibacter sp.]
MVNIPTFRLPGDSDRAGQYREDIHPGLEVDIILKQDQRTGKLTRGIVRDLLTSSKFHSRGIKVRLDNGQVGRVAQIIGD